MMNLKSAKHPSALGFTVYHMLHFLFLQWVLPRVPSLQGKSFPPTWLFPPRTSDGLEMLRQTALHSNDSVFRIYILADFLKTYLKMDQNIRTESWR